MFQKKMGTFSMKKNTVSMPNKNKQRPVGVANRSKNTIIGVASK
jgi:hypothetical protein